MWAAICLVLVTASKVENPAKPMVPRAHWTAKIGDETVVWSDGLSGQWASMDRLAMERLAETWLDNPSEIDDIGKNDRCVFLPHKTRVRIARTHFTDRVAYRSSVIEVEVMEGEYSGKRYWILLKSVSKLAPVAIDTGDNATVKPGKRGESRNVWASKWRDSAHMLIHANLNRRADREAIEYLEMNSRIFQVGSGTPVRVIGRDDEICLVDVTDGKFAGSTIWIDARHLSPSKSSHIEKPSEGR